MEKLENMEKIEAAQAALGEFLVSMMPVSWKKICYYYKKWAVHQRIVMLSLRQKQKRYVHIILSGGAMKIIRMKEWKQRTR